MDIKEHSFFKDVNWEKLSNRKIRPPFVPESKKVNALAYFSSEFTTMETRSERGESGSAFSEWTGFTFMQ